MKKIKGLALVAVFALAMVNPQQAEAKERTFAHVFANGCVGTHTYHSSFFGLFQWETFEVLACP
jgi:hypothetical protein